MTNVIKPSDFKPNGIKPSDHSPRGKLKHITTTTTMNIIFENENQISLIFVINQVSCVSSCWGEKTHVECDCSTYQFQKSISKIRTGVTSVLNCRSSTLSHQKTFSIRSAKMFNFFPTTSSMASAMKFENLRKKFVI